MIIIYLKKYRIRTIPALDPIGIGNYAILYLKKKYILLYQKYNFENN